MAVPQNDREPKNSGPAGNPAAQYLLFFIKHKKIQHFFGDRVLVYSAVLLMMFAATLGLLMPKITSANDILDIGPPIMVLLMGAFVVAHSVSLAALAASRLSKEHEEYTSYLGFTKRQTRVLTRLIFLPATLVSIIWYLFLFTILLPWGPRILITALSVLAGDALCFVFLRIQRKRKKRSKAAQEQQTANKQAVLRRFRNPYGAFFQRDLHAVRTLEMIASCAAVALITLIAIIYTCVMPYSLSAYIVCLYIILTLTLGFTVYGLYKAENKAYRYYRTELRLKDSQILSYKMPLPLFCAVVALVVFSVPVGLAHGFQSESLLVLLGALVYTVIYCLSLSIWYLRRLHKGRLIQGFYEYLSSLGSFIPGVVPIYLLVFLICKAVKRLMRGGRPQHA